jgi:hypothetical protein
MSDQGKKNRSSKDKKSGKYKAIFMKHVKKFGKWRGKKWDGIKLLGKSLKTNK